jgi:hypothetical protein
MQIKDTTQISEVISKNYTRDNMGYGWVSYSMEYESDLYFLLITRDKKGEELPQYFWDLEEPEMNWLESKGVELTPY